MQVNGCVAMADLFGVDLYTILEIVIIALVALSLERIFTRYLSRFAKRAKLERSVSNNLVLTFRILILIGAVLAVSRIGGLQAEWLVSISAIGGAESRPREPTAARVVMAATPRAISHVGKSYLLVLPAWCWRSPA